MKSRSRPAVRAKLSISSDFGSLRISRGVARQTDRGNIIWLAFNTHLISIEEYPDRKERAQNPAERFIYSQGLHTLFQIHQRIRDFLQNHKKPPHLLLRLANPRNCIDFYQPSISLLGFEEIVNSGIITFQPDALNKKEPSFYTNFLQHVYFMGKICNPCIESNIIRKYKK